MAKELFVPLGIGIPIAVRIGVQLLLLPVQLIGQTLDGLSAGARRSVPVA